MPRFRMKPVEVDALQLRWDTWSEMCEFANVGAAEDGKPHGCYVDGDGKVSAGATQRMGLLIPTPEGVVLGVEGDWIVKGVQGELSPCEPGIFEQTYELVA